MIDPDNEPTQPVPPTTMAQIAAQWEADLAEYNARQTKDLRPTKRVAVD
jgi:hypothetical protein